MAKDPGVLLEAVLIECIALQQVFAQGARGPLAEMPALFAVDAVAHRENGVEVIVLEWSRSVLGMHIETRLLEREGQAITNFAERLPAPASASQCMKGLSATVC